MATDEAPSVPGVREIGATGILVNPIGLDASVFGWATGVPDTAAILDRFRTAGGNFLSTADHYAGGRSEIMIGSWLRTVDDRSSVILATKVGRHPDAPGLSQRSILRAVEASLERLGTDYIDFLSFDGDDPESPIEEALEAVDRLMREGKVRVLSASRFDAARIREIDQIAQERGYPRFGAIFVEYNLMDPEPYETTLAPLAVGLGRGAVARLPLANGYLTGQFRTRDAMPDGVVFDDAERHIGRRGNRVLDAVATVADELGATSAAVAVAWVLLKPGVAAAVLRVTDPSELESLLATAPAALTRQQLALLDKASSP